MHIKINPGTILLVPMSKVIGGKTRSTRKVSHAPINAGDGERIEYDVKVEIADKEERAEGEALIQRATHAVRSRATHTPIGYLADASQLSEIIAAYGELKRAADGFNARAKFSQVDISVAPFEIGQQMATNEECAKALADHIRGELESVRSKLLAGDVIGVRNVLLRCKRMYALATGTQADGIKFAIEESASALKALNDAIKRGETPESAGRALAGDPANGKPSGIPMIDAAIETFTYAPEAHAPELPADLAGEGATSALPANNPVALSAA